MTTTLTNCAPVLVSVASQVHRVLDSDERQCLQNLSAQGMAKLNRDQCAGVPLESTLGDLKTVYRMAKRKHILAVQSLQEKNPKLAPGLLDRRAVSSSDLVSLLAKVPEAKLQKLNAKPRGDNDKLVDMALDLRDEEMHALAERATIRFGMQARICHLSPTSLGPDPCHPQPYTPNPLHDSPLSNPFLTEMPTGGNEPSVIPSPELRSCISLPNLGGQKFSLTSRSHDPPSPSSRTPASPSLLPTSASFVSAQQQLPCARFRVVQTPRGKPVVALNPVESWFKTTNEDAFLTSSPVKVVVRSDASSPVPILKTRLSPLRGSPSLPPLSGEEPRSSSDSSSSSVQGSLSPENLKFESDCRTISGPRTAPRIVFKEPISSSSSLYSA